MSPRAEMLGDFYSLLGDLERRLGGTRRLDTASGGDGWPLAGVYFFFEDGEGREGGRASRVVRVGTHALALGSRSTLWGRLRQHRGPVTGASAGIGNHRASVFRQHVGAALISPDTAASQASWCRARVPPMVREAELPLEGRVSRRIGSMPFLWLGVEDLPGPGSDRAVIERGSIALLSNHSRAPIDSPSAGWLGSAAVSGEVRLSGLWNVRHVREKPPPRFLEVLGEWVRRA